MVVPLEEQDLLYLEDQCPLEQEEHQVQEHVVDQQEDLLAEEDHL